MPSFSSTYFSPDFVVITLASFFAWPGVCAGVPDTKTTRARAATAGRNTWFISRCPLSGAGASEKQHYYIMDSPNRCRNGVVVSDPEHQVVQNRISPPSAAWNLWIIRWKTGVKITPAATI